jgi:hypothetical protein
LHGFLSLGLKQQRRQQQQQQAASDGFATWPMPMD